MGELDVAGWRQSLDEELRHRIIPFWRSLRDDDYGGYFGRVDWDLNRWRFGHKAALLNSRIMWFFATAAKRFGDEDLLAEAQHAFRFLVDHCLDHAGGGVVWSVSHDGTWRDTTKQAYNQAFAIYALAAYYRVSRDKAALDLAFDLFELVERRFGAAPGYIEAFDQSFRPIANDKLSENGVLAERTMNTLLHTFEAYAGLYQASDGEAAVGQAMGRILDLFCKRIYNQTERRLEVFFDAKLAPLLNLQSFGHDIEASWLLVWGTDLLGDPKLSQRASEIGAGLVDSVYNRAYRDGSVAFESLDSKLNTSRVWWVQAEAMVAFYAASTRTPDPRRARLYRQASHQLWDFCSNRLADPRPGSEWFWAVDAVGQPVPGQPIASTWKCPYHSGRACLEMLAYLETQPGTTVTEDERAAS